MDDENLNKIIAEMDESINQHLKGNDHYFYHLAKVNKQSAVAIIELIKTVRRLDGQNSKLEKTNVRLQWTMVALTIVTTILTIITIIKH